MSRVHDALRRAEKTGVVIVPPTDASAPPNAPASAEPHSPSASMDTGAKVSGSNLAGLLELVEEVPFRTATDSLLIDAARPHEAPMEEFRTLRTRLNHMQSLQPIHTVVVTSASPAAPMICFRTAFDVMSPPSRRLRRERGTPSHG